MRFFDRHTPLLAAILLILFFAASSGFTLLLSHCTMCGDAEETACCCEGQSSYAESFPNSGWGTGTGETLAGYASPCLVVTIAGGLQTEPTILEKESGGRHVLKAALPEEPAFNLWSDQKPDGAHLPSAAFRALPPAVEKYVLDLTFRI